MTRFEIAGPAPAIDGRRMFWGRPTLSARDCAVLEQIRYRGGLVCHTGGETIFSSNGAKLPRQAVLRLLRLRHLVTADDGLFPGTSWGQTLLVNVTPPPDPGSVSCGAIGGAVSR
jgi:hypothetical protein